MQKIENEVTVKVNMDYDSLHRCLIALNYRIVKQFLVKDNYMAQVETDFSTCNLYDLFNESIQVREMVGMAKELIHKHKEYDHNGNIVNQLKTACEIFDIEETEKFMIAIGYKSYLTIDDQCYVYCNGDIEFIVQVINNHDVFIELEDIPRHSSRVYEDIHDMIAAMNEVEIDFDHSDYFVKKAMLLFKEKYRR